MVEWTEVAAAGLWGGVVALERRAFLQAMASRPLVAATVTGLLLGDIESGLYVGLVLELFHLGAASLGAALSENDTLAATCTAAGAAGLSAGSGTAAAWAGALLLFAGMGGVGRWLDRALERHSSRLVSKAMASAEQGDLKRAVRHNLWGMWPYFVAFGGLTVAAAATGIWLGPFFERLPLPLARGLAWAYPVMASVSAAMAVRGSHARHPARYATAAAAAVLAFAGATALLQGAGR